MLDADKIVDAPGATTELGARAGRELALLGDVVEGARGGARGVASGSPPQRDVNPGEIGGNAHCGRAAARGQQHA